MVNCVLKVSPTSRVQNINVLFARWVIFEELIELLLMIKSLFFQKLMNTDYMVSLNLDGNEIHVLLVTLQIEWLESIMNENQIESLENLIVVSAVFLWLILGSDEAGVEHRLLVAFGANFELRDVE